MRVGIDVHFFQPIIVQFRYFDVGRKSWHTDGDCIAFIKYLVLFQRVENIGHGSSSAFDRKYIEFIGTHVTADHLAHEIMLHNLFADLQHTRRNRIVTPKNAFHHFMQIF